MGGAEELSRLEGVHKFETAATGRSVSLAGVEYLAGTLFKVKTWREAFDRDKGVNADEVVVEQVLCEGWEFCFLDDIMVIYGEEYIWVADAIGALRKRRSGDSEQDNEERCDLVHSSNELKINR